MPIVSGTEQFGFKYALVSLVPFPLMDCPHGSAIFVWVPQLGIFHLDGLGGLLASPEL